MVEKVSSSERPGGASGYGIEITSPDGKTERYSSEEANSFGLTPQAIATADKMTLYTNDNTKYSTKPTYKAELDYSTGKVRLNVSKSLMDRNPEFVKNMVKNTALKQAAALYEAGNSEKVFTDPSDKNKTYSAKELIDMFNEDLGKEISAYQVIAEAQDALNEMGGGAKFTEDQAKLALSFLDKEKDKNSTTTIVQLPTWIDAKKYGFSGYDSYDAETNSINAKDFYHWYNLDHPAEGSDKSKEQLINDLQERLRAAASTHMFFSEEGEEVEGTKNDFVKSLALQKTMSSSTPDVDNFFSGMNFFWGSFAKSFEANFINTVLSVTEVVDAFSQQYGTGFAHSIIQGLEVTGLVWGEALMENDYDLGKLATNFSKEGAQEYLTKKLDNVYKTIGIDTLSDSQSLINLAQTTYNAAAVYPTLEYMRSMSSYAGAGEFLGNMAAEIVKQVIITNPVGKGVSNLISTWYNVPLRTGIKYYLHGLSVADRIRVMQAAAQGAKGLNFLGNILAQGFMDALMHDGDMITAAIKQNDANTAGTILFAVGENAVYNTLGEATGLGVGKGMEAFKKTKIGKVINAIDLKVINKFAAKKYKLIADFEDWVHGVERAPSQGDVYVAKSHRPRQRAAENIANKKVFGTEQGFDAAYEELQLLVYKRVNLENQYRMAQYGSGVFKKVIDESISKEVTENYNNAVGKVNKSLGAKLTADEVSAGYAIPKDADQYVIYKNTKLSLEREMAAKKALGGNLTKEQTESLEYYTNAVKKFEDTHSAEQLAALEEYRLAAGKYMYEFNNFAIKFFGEDSDIAKEIERIRKTGYYGENGDEWLPTLYLQEGEDAIAAGYRQSQKNFIAQKEYSQMNRQYNAPDKPMASTSMAMIARKTQLANAMQAKEWGNALIGVTGIVREIDTLGLSEKTAKELKNYRKVLHSNIRKNLAQLVKEGGISDDLFYNLKESIKAKKGALKEAKTALGETKAQLTKKLRITDSSKRTFARNMTPDQVGTIGKHFDLPDFAREMTEEEFQEFFASLPKESQTAIKKAIGKNDLSYANYKQAIETTDNLQNTLTKNYIANTKKIVDSDTYFDMMVKEKMAKLNAQQQTVLAPIQKQYEETYNNFKRLEKQNSISFEGPDPAKFNEGIIQVVSDIQETLGKTIFNDPAAKSMLQMFMDAGIDEEAAKRFIILSALSDTNGKFAIKDLVEHYLEQPGSFKSLTKAGKQKYKPIIEKALNDQIESELNFATRVILDEGGEGLADMEAVFKRVSGYVKDIEGAYSDPNVISIIGEDGNLHLVEVDPVVAELYNTRPNFSAGKAGLVGRFFRQTNRLMRLGTTGWSLSSFENQWMRDPLNSYVMGGLVRTIKGNIAELSNLMGSEVVAALQKELTDAGWEDFVKQATKGIDPNDTVAREIAIRNAAIEREVRTGAEIHLEDEASTSMRFFRGSDKTLAGAATGDQAAWIAATKKAKKSLLRKIEDMSPGEWREVNLRKMNYAQAYNNAIYAGRSIQEARSWAQYVMENATTDFSRQFGMCSRLINSIPYFGAAINGTASFWRLLEVDPVAISGRFMCGLVLPMISLVAQSMDSEENRKVYAAIPEYEKQDAIAFVINGTPFTIPIPQELSTFLNPIRHFVEKNWGTSDNTWLELISNDLLAIPAIDLSEFVDLDYNKLLGEPSFLDRLNRLGQSAISQLSPTIVKTAYMAITGIDPYTGNAIDKSYVYYDKDGNMQIMDYTDSSLARWVSSWFGNDLSPSSAYALLKNFFGKGLVNIADNTVDLFTGNFNSIAQRIGESAQSPFTMYKQDEANKAWNEAVSTLEAKKAEIIASGQLQKINSQISLTDDEDKRRTLVGQYDTIVQEYQKEVIDMANRLKTVYNENYDKNKLASVISLLNFEDGTTARLGGQTAIDAANEAYYAGREQAISTMYNLGFKGDYDYSIFGYMKTDKYGNVEKVEYSPLAILNATNIYYSQGDVHEANIEQLLKSNNITRKEMFYGDHGYYTNIKKGMSKKKAKAEWNKYVVPVIYNYINKNNWGEEILDNSQVVDMLEDYIFVDNPYKTKDYLKKLLLKGK